MNNSTELDLSSGREPMCQGLKPLALMYWHIHPYVILAICTFGITTNIVNIVILCQKKMRSSINCILTGIAVSDIITMADYVPYAVHFYIMTDLNDHTERRTFGWTHYLAVHSCLSITTHTLSLWLAVLMSTVRYLFIRSSGRWNLNILKTRLAIVGIFIGTVILSVPLYAVTDVQHATYDNNVTLYHIRSVKVYYNNTSIMDVFNVWLLIIVGKLLPCCLICVFGCLLLQTLRQSQQLTENLKLTCSRRMRAHKRTTRMLLAIMTMFIISALPAAILMLVSVFVKHFFFDCYLLLADALDFLSLTNNAINFIMYCVMSRQFRDCLCEAIPVCGTRFIQAKYQPATSVNSASRRPSVKNCNL